MVFKDENQFVKGFLVDYCIANRRGILMFIKFRSITCHNVNDFCTLR